METLIVISPWDFASVTATIALYFFVGMLIESARVPRLSVTRLMRGYRHAWMREMVTREPRIFDATILASLRQGTSFFASTCVFAIGGVIALIGNGDRIGMVAASIFPNTAPPALTEFRLALVAVFLTIAFLRFVWANRVFGYSAVAMAATPNQIDTPEAYCRAAQAAELNIRAAINFNRGLRAMYFALASVAWLMGPGALAVAILGTCWMLLSREFYSLPRQILAANPPSDPGFAACLGSWTREDAHPEQHSLGATPLTQPSENHETRG